MYIKTLKMLINFRYWFSFSNIDKKLFTIIVPENLPKRHVLFKLNSSKFCHFNKKVFYFT